MKVAVLMSTYNGEKYIREQIESIFKQKRVDIELYIRDDGSTDDTVSIIKQYNKIHFKRGENFGVGNSFMNLVYSVPDEFDYYAFSDQDDVWEDEKIVKAVEKLQDTGKLLYGSNQKLIDKNGDVIGKRMLHCDNVNKNPIEVMEYNKIPGCTMVFDKRLKDILCSHKPSVELLNVRIHDVWVSMVASLYDGIIYDEMAYVCYRQHENNSVGVYAKGWGESVKIKFGKIINKSERNGRSKIARETVELFAEECKKYKILYKSACPKKLSNKMYLIKNRNELKKYSNETTIGLIAKIIFNFY